LAALSVSEFGVLWGGMVGMGPLGEGIMLRLVDFLEFVGELGFWFANWGFEGDKEDDAARDVWNGIYVRTDFTKSDAFHKIIKLLWSAKDANVSICKISKTQLRETRAKK
jgi:hypothetical protein